ncbi:PAS domain-containing protein [Fibrella sp. HMF5036]|uniref:histidine kinase n=2 Tax=Fibrella aquatilis TaxID=2817059 RepID=A0A939JWC3_9BACT|nr:PAS domain-containing protein [Fibrella aquatilis]
MQTMLDGSLSGVLLLEAMYDSAGQVDDFRILATNQTLSDITGIDGQAIIGQTMGGVYPGYKEGGFFALYCQTQNDGKPRRGEYYYEDERLTGWFEVSIARQDNHLVLTTTNTTEAHKATETATLATKHLQTVIDLSQVGIFVFSPVLDEAGQLVDFRFKTINRMVAALVGQTPDVITGAVASDWFISYRETGLFDYYRHTYLTGEMQRFDIHYNVDGFDVWFDVQSVRVDNDVLVTFTDYTLLKQAQQALELQAADNQHQAELINSVLDSSDSGIIAFDAIRGPAQQGQIIDFRFMVVNRACIGLLGKTIDEMVGNTLLTIFPGNVETGLFDLYKQTTETGQPGRTEVYYNHDGLDFWLDISAQKLGDGFVVTFTDVSPIKRANKAVEASAAELTTVIDTAQAGIFLFEPVFGDHNQVVDFRFRLANRQLAAYVGQEPAAVIGELGSRWFPGYKTNGLFDTYLKAYVTGRTQRFDFHYDTDGIDVWLDIMATKMGNEVLVTFADYTNLKRLQRQLEHSIIDLRRSNESLQQFAYVASHDLQEPLRKIQSFGDVLQQRFGPELGEMGSDLISRMQIASARMSSLIHDLLTYSRLSAKPGDLKPVALTNVVARVLDDLDLTIRETGAIIQAIDLPTLPGDESQLRQLFQNLLTNALKFRKVDIAPVITIHSQEVLLENLPQTISPPRKVPVYQCITIVDNGIGFDQKYADRIFQVFQRLHTRAQYDGTGIGLAIVKRVIDNHSGAIRAHSTPGQGATFELYLPI